MLSGQSQDHLRDAQRGWIAFRDAECRLRSSSVIGGSIYPLVHAQCMTELTEQRAEQLRALANCEEGDFSCPR